jgi:glycosyltransferase involved in cell wall biosynthesis
MQQKNKEKKLIYILNYVHQFDTQHFVHVIQLLKELELRCKWDVKLLSEKGGEGTKVVHGKEVKYLSKNGKYIRLYSLVMQLVELRSKGYRVIFVRISQPAALTSAIVAKILRMKVVFWQSGTVHDLDKNNTTIKNYFNQIIIKLIIYNIDKFATGPESMIDYYNKTLKISQNKLLLLYNDIDLKRFLPIKKINQSKIIKLLIVHRFSPVRQTTIYFPAIIEKLNSKIATGVSFELTMIGEGPEIVELKEQAKIASIGVKIDFLGATPNSLIQKYYAEADLFLMPSYREGFPRVIIEAMAMRLAIVATDAGGTKDIVGPQQLKYIVSRDDPEAFASRMMELVMNKELREEISQENLFHVRRYATPIVADMYDRALSKLI